jgi:hypothetical protein
MKPITDKAEIAIDFPDKAYVGAFSRHSEFAVTADAEGILIKLVQPGDDRRMAEIHLHYFLLADILAEAAKAISEKGEVLDSSHGEALLAAANQLAKALARPKARRPRK